MGEATTMTLAVGGMTCTGCAGNVQRALEAVEGVASAAVDHVAGSANIAHSGVAQGALEAAVTSAGYSVGETTGASGLHQLGSPPTGTATAAAGDTKWTLSVIACGLLLFLDALLLPAGGWLQLALKAVMVVGAIGCLLATQWVVKTAGFDWSDGDTWWQSANNTKWCLIGCSIGEFGTLGYYQWAQWPLQEQVGTPFFWFLVILPLINGLATSVALETVLLMKGQMDFSNALSTAFGMSFISMLAMEIAMELTDWLLTGGIGMTWWVIPPMLVVGFLTPWPYNYWRLKKYGQACH